MYVRRLTCLVLFQPLLLFTTSIFYTFPFPFPFICISPLLQAQRVVFFGFIAPVLIVVIAGAYVLRYLTSDKSFSSFVCFVSCIAYDIWRRWAANLPWKDLHCSFFSSINTRAIWPPSYSLLVSQPPIINGYTVNMCIIIIIILCDLVLLYICRYLYSMEHSIAIDRISCLSISLEQ